MTSFERSKFYPLNYSKLSYENQISTRGHVKYRNFMGLRLIENLKISCSDEIASSHNCSITSLAIDKIDNRYLLSGGVNGTVSLYDLECYSKSTKRSIERLNVIQSNQMTNANAPGFHTTITSLQWYPNDCGLFLASNLHGEVFLYDTETFQAAGCFKFPGQKVYQARFRVLDPNNPIIAVAVDDGTIHLCDIRIGDSVHIIKGHTAGVSAVDWSPIHANQLASASYDGTVRVWDVRGTGSACLMSLDWRQDHTAVADRDTTRLSLPASRINTSNTHNINQSMNTERRPNNEVSIYDGGGNSSGGSAQNNIIDLTSSDHSHNHTPTIISDSIQQYRYLSTSHNTNTSHRMIRNNGASSSSLNTHLAKAHESEVLSMRYTPDGNYLLTAGNDSHLRLWNSSSGKLQPTHYELPRMDRRSLPFALEIISPTSKPKDDLIIFPDHSNSSGNNLSSIGDLLLVPVHSGTGKVKSILKGHMGGVNSTVYRSKYKQVISAGKDGLILLWEDSRVNNSSGGYNNRNHNQHSKQRNTTSNSTSSSSNVLDSYTAMMRNASRRYDYLDTVNSLYIDQNHNTNCDNNANSSSSNRNIVLDAYCVSDAECDDGDDCDTWSDTENIPSESVDKITTDNSELYRLYGANNSSSGGNGNNKHRKERKGVLSDTLKKYLSQDIHHNSNSTINSNSGNNSSTINYSSINSNSNTSVATANFNKVDNNNQVNIKEVDWENVDQLFSVPDTTTNISNTTTTTSSSSSSSVYSKALAATTPTLYNNSNGNSATTLSSGRRNTVPNATARSAANTAGFHTEGSSSTISGTISKKKTGGRDEILKQLNKRSKKK